MPAQFWLGALFGASSLIAVFGSAMLTRKIVKARHKDEYVHVCYRDDLDC
jgi:hypothetical protein